MNQVLASDCMTHDEAFLFSPSSSNKSSIHGSSASCTRATTTAVWETQEITMVTLTGHN